MRPMHVAEDILPIAEFKARASEVIRHLRGRDRPLVVTLNGRPAAVLLSPEEFDRLALRERFVAAVREGVRDADRGDVLSDEAFGREIDREFPRKRPAPRGK